MWDLAVGEALKEVLFRYFSLHLRKLRRWEDCDLPKDPKLTMGPEPNLKAPNSLSSVFSTQAGLVEGVEVSGAGGGQGNWGGRWEGQQNSS